MIRARRLTWLGTWLVELFTHYTYVCICDVFDVFKCGDASFQIGLVVLDYNPAKAYEYLIITVTGARTSAGTTSNVFCSLNNQSKRGEPRYLYDPSEKQAFQRDQINAFKVSFEEPIEDITDIRIWHDNTGMVFSY